VPQGTAVPPLQGGHGLPVPPVQPLRGRATSVLVRPDFKYRGFRACERGVVSSS